VPSGVDSVTLKRILYIGQSENIGNRIKTHERYEDWVSELEWGEYLCFSFAPIARTEVNRFAITDMDIAEAALINFHKPTLNDDFKDHFPYEETNIVISGEKGLLNSYFTVPLVRRRRSVRNAHEALGLWN
jgi:hypothetical protein